MGDGEAPNEVRRERRGWREGENARGGVSHSDICGAALYMLASSNIPVAVSQLRLM